MPIKPADAACPRFGCCRSSPNGDFRIGSVLPDAVPLLARIRSCSSSVPAVAGSWPDSQGLKTHQRSRARVTQWRPPTTAALLGKCASLLFSVLVHDGLRGAFGCGLHPRWRLPLRTFRRCPAGGRVQWAAFSLRCLLDVFLMRLHVGGPRTFLRRRHASGWISLRAANAACE